ncbi:MAG: hypothetical protein ABEJ72_09255 [Candidatus Aenigmatarchaeota archaeon]
MIGTIIQRQETPSSREFFFVHEGDVGKGSYLEYINNGTVIARVAEVYTMNEYFENEEGVSELMKDSSPANQRFPVDDWEVSIGKAVIMGKFSESNRIERVSESPSPGMELEKADPGRITTFLGLLKQLST